MPKSKTVFVCLLLLCLSFAGCPSTVTVPDVTDMTQAVASSTLVAAKLTVGNVTTQSSDSVAAGYVISQNPTAGASVASGTAVNLVVSTGPTTGALTPSVAWTYGPTANAIWAQSIDKTSDNGFIIGGGNTGYNMYALKLSATGAYQWDQTYSNLVGSTEYWRCIAYDLRPTPDGGYIMAGAGRHPSDVLPDKSYLLVKLTSSGGISWSKAYAPVNPYDANSAKAINDYPGAVCATADGGYAVLGSSYCGQYDLASIVKTNSTGEQTFATVINDNAKAYDQQIVAGQQTSDNGYILAGYSGNGAPEGYLALLIKVNSGGSLQWSQKYNYPPADHGAIAYAVSQTSDGGYIVGGELINNINNNKAQLFGAWMAKVNSSGSTGGVGCWSRSYASVGTIATVNAVKQTPQGDYLAVGQMGGKLTLAKFDGAGTHLWNYQITTCSSVGKDLVLTGDGGCVILASGNTSGPSYAIKVNGCYAVD